MLLSVFLSLLLSPSSHAIETVRWNDYDDCNWIVNYRGRTYDLAPLTRETLARPIESDLRHVLQRVPEADLRLQSMTKNLSEARGHTMIASAFISTFLLVRILGSGQKNVDRRDEYNLLSYIAAVFFSKATYESWTHTREAKKDLIEAVNAFNERSPHQIEPAKTKVIEQKPLGESDAKKNRP